MSFATIFVIRISEPSRKCCLYTFFPFPFRSIRFHSLRPFSINRRPIHAYMYTFIEDKKFLSLLWLCFVCVHVIFFCSTVDFGEKEHFQMPGSIHINAHLWWCVVMGLDVCVCVFVRCIHDAWMYTKCLCMNTDVRVPHSMQNGRYVYTLCISPDVVHIIHSMWMYIFARACVWVCVRACLCVFVYISNIITSSSSSSSTINSRFFCVAYIPIQFLHMFFTSYPDLAYSVNGERIQLHTAIPF